MGTVDVGTIVVPDSRIEKPPSSSRILRSWVTSVGSHQAVNTSSSWSMSSRPWSRPVSMMSSSLAPSASTTTRPRRLNMNATAPGSARLPPTSVNALRTSDAVRLRLSVRQSTSTATPFGA